MIDSCHRIGNTNKKLLGSRCVIIGSKYPIQSLAENHKEWAKEYQYNAETNEFLHQNALNIFIITQHPGKLIAPNAIILIFGF